MRSSVRRSTEFDASANGCVGPPPREGGTITSKLKDQIPLAERWKGLDLRLLPIDEVDVRILSRLRENARLSNVDIARDLGISEATVRRRIQSLEDKGIIQGYSCYLNYHLIENPVKAYVHLSIDPSRRESVVGKIVAHARAIAVYRVTGDHDVLAVMFFVDMSELHDFLDRYLQMEGIREVRTQIVMSPYKGVPWTGV
ncbi:MAG TPA: Lrp/AsnC family transcriptional regulator [Thermoplasmata archaeon]|nr:Lrp/AsnC family transcriptional regulator [Thermoplasmata archaeon]